MRPHWLIGVAFVLLLAGGAGFVYYQRYFVPSAPVEAEHAADPHDHDHEHPDRVELSPEARANLKLVVQPLKRQTWWRSIQVPGLITDRPGQSDQGITAPMAAVVTRVHAFPGDTVKPGDPLFTLRLVSENLQTTQAELFKTLQEAKLNQEQIDRLQEATRTGAIPMARMIELDNQQRRLAAQERAARQDLLTRGLTPQQLEEIGQGRFVKEITVVTPPPGTANLQMVSARAQSPGQPVEVPQAFEVQELRVHLGEQVQPGQLLALLANHRQLLIEGRGFKNEAALLERAAEQGWPLEAEFPEDDASTWGPLQQPLHIRHLANIVDPDSRTFAFYVPLMNQSRSYVKEGQTFLIWRFRPGQRVRLHVPVEEFRDALVLPAAAVVREGPEAWVFRQNGDSFDRRPVRILYEDRRQVVIAGDGGVAPGQYVAQNGAAALQRILKAHLAGGEGGHDHHDHHH